MRFFFALCCCTCLLASEAADDTWDPHAHPAVLRRDISAFTKARRHMSLAAEYAGRVQAISVDSGDLIENGSAVIKLDDRLVRLQQQEAATSVATLRIALEQTRIEARLAERQRAFEASELKRIAGLAERGQAPEQELDRQRFQLDSASIGIENAQARVRAAEQALASGEAALALAYERLARHQVDAPSGWTVTARHAEPGSVVAPQQPVLELADTRSLLVDCALTEREIAALRAVDAIELRFPQQHDHRAEARLHRVAVLFDALTRKRQVELILDGADAPERSGGLEVRFSLAVADPAGGLQVPVRYVRWISEQPFVTGSDGVRRSPTVLRREGGMIVVAANSVPRGVLLQPMTEEP